MYEKILLTEYERNYFPAKKGESREFKIYSLFNCEL